MSRPDSNARIDLSEQGNLTRWMNLLDKTNAYMDSGIFTEYERGFINDMFRRTRDEWPMWSPTRKQYNYLHTLVSSL